MTEKKAKKRKVARLSGDSKLQFDESNFSVDDINTDEDWESSTTDVKSKNRYLHPPPH